MAISVGNIIIMVLTIIVTTLTIVEKSKKVKWRPLSWLFGRDETNKSIDEIKKMVGVLSTKMDNMCQTETEHHKADAKILISGFATDLRNAQKCGKQPLDARSITEFIAISDLCKEYLDKNWNSQVRHDAEFISNVYKSLDEKLK